MKLLGRDQHDLTGVYALNAITGAEQDRFERHLGGCDPCVSEVRSLHETVSELALAVAAPPPPGFRERVLAAVPSVAQLPAVPDLAAEPPARGTSAEPARPARRRPAHKRPAHRLRRDRRVGLLPGLAMGAAAIATAFALVLGIRLVSVEDQLNASKAALGVSRAEQQALTQLLNTPGVVLLAAKISVGGAATAVIVPGQKKLVVLTKGLPALPPGKVYQVWLIGKSPVPIRNAGLLPQPTANGTATLLASGLIKGDTLGITVEPFPGTKQPTTKVLVAIPLKR